MNGFRCLRQAGGSASNWSFQRGGGLRYVEERRPGSFHCAHRVVLWLPRAGDSRAAALLMSSGSRSGNAPRSSRGKRRKGAFVAGFQFQLDLADRRLRACLRRLPRCTSPRSSAASIFAPSCSMFQKMREKSVRNSAIRSARRVFQRFGARVRRRRPRAARRCRARRPLPAFPIRAGCASPPSTCPTVLYVCSHCVRRAAQAQRAFRVRELQSRRVEVDVRERDRRALAAGAFGEEARDVVVLRGRQRQLDLAFDTQNDRPDTSEEHAREFRARIVGAHERLADEERMHVHRAHPLDIGAASGCPTRSRRCGRRESRRAGRSSFRATSRRCADCGC